MPADFRIRPAGDSALVVEFEERIDPALSARVLALEAALTADPPPGVRETLPTYRSLLVRFDPLDPGAEVLEATLASRAAVARGAANPGRLWRIPCAYGGAHGEDLEGVARAKSLTTDEVVRIHATTPWHVYMIGFAPGATYLGKLDARLHLPRRANPRARVPAGSVPIAGQQGLIMSIAMPSGWHLLGQTPVRLFEPRRAEPFLLAPGDRVRFEPISAAEYDRLDRLAERGEVVAEVTA
ncbi:MAG: 5-oxoprolinase subunit PxpB [Deltaproteobacteria bacterium]|nr:5-oxoprolinase subunit PxpB [Deltaproteobacteria bacterium]